MSQHSPDDHEKLVDLSRGISKLSLRLVAQPQCLFETKLTCGAWPPNPSSRQCPVSSPHDNSSKGGSAKAQRTDHKANEATWSFKSWRKAYRVHFIHMRCRNFLEKILTLSRKFQHNGHSESLCGQQKAYCFCLISRSSSKIWLPRHNLRWIQQASAGEASSFEDIAPRVKRCRAAPADDEDVPVAYLLMGGRACGALEWRAVTLRTCYLHPRIFTTLWW